MPVSEVTLTSLVDLEQANQDVFARTIADDESFELLEIAEAGEDDTLVGELSAVEKERELAAARRWDDLIEHYLERLEIEVSPLVRAEFMRRIAAVFLEQLGDPAQAYDGLLLALRLDPMHEPTAIALERLARERGEFDSLVESIDEFIAVEGDPEKELRFCELVIDWWRKVEAPSDLIEPYLARIRRLDRTHPLAVRRAHRLWDAKIEQLARAVAAASKSERAPLRVELARVYEEHIGDLGEALKQYEFALHDDDACTGALLGLERIYLAEERFGEVETVLLRLAEVAVTERERILALVRLADIHERVHVNPKAARALYERILTIDAAYETALVGLARTCGSMRDWPALVEVLDARADAAPSEIERVKALVRKAEVEDAKLGDHAAAIATYRRIARVRALGEYAHTEIARLAVAMGDWAAAAEARARLAQLLPDEKASSQILCGVGNMLEKNAGDRAGARAFYERATMVDPSNGAAWEALRRHAEEDNDAARVGHCLEEHASHAEIPRIRAQLFVELALHRRRHEDEAGALVAFERAIVADPTNEVSAGALLPRFIETKRWGDAEPLCELLMKAATRDDDVERVFLLLRQATRVAVGLGKEDRALDAALLAYRMRPEDADTRDEALQVVYYVRKNAELLKSARADVDAFARADDLPTPSLAILADVYMAMGDGDRAIGVLARLLSREPTSIDGLSRMSEAYASRGDWEKACASRVRHARIEPDFERKCALLLQAADDYAARTDRRAMAARTYEELLAARARESKDPDRGVLHKLLAIHSREEQWEKVVDTLGLLSRIETDVDRKAKEIFTMAQAVEEELNDPYRAAVIYEEALQVAPHHTDAFERIERIYQDAGDWEKLERAYRLMISHVPAPEGDMTYTLWRKLGALYKDHLGDANRAIDAFRAARALRPDDGDDLRKMLELLVVTGRLDEAVVLARTAVHQRPLDPCVYEELYTLLLRRRAFDKAWCALDTLAHLGPLSPEQTRFLEDYPPPGLDAIPGTLLPEAWASHVLHPKLDRSLTTLFAIMTPAVLRVRFAALHASQRQALLGEPATPNVPRGSPLGRALRAVEDACEVLSLPRPEMRVRRGPAPFVAAPTGQAMLLVSPEAVSALAPEGLAFLACKRLAEMRPELMARSAFLGVTELAAVVAAAARICRSPLAAPLGAPTQEDERLQAAIAAGMTPEEQGELRRAVEDLTNRGRTVDVRRWSQFADATSSRAGLLVVGHMDIAKRALLLEPQSPCDLPPRERLAELLIFATSDEYSDLRVAIGVAVSVD